MADNIDRMIQKLTRVSEGKTWRTEREKHKKKLDARNKKRNQLSKARKASSAKASANVEKQLVKERKDATKFARKVTGGGGGGPGGGRWVIDPKTGRRQWKIM